MAEERSTPTPPVIERLEGLARTFDTVGPRIAGRLQDLCALRADERVLDVGCGIGRVALPLTSYLSPAGSYEGFDIVADAIDWCSEHITTQHPNFRFQHVPIHNERYNPEGTVRDAEFVFPYDDATFDVVFLSSVFTHMLPAGVAQYLGQIVRVLRPGGRMLVTMFLLNEESDRLRTEPASMLRFANEFGVYALGRKHPPENAVAYREDYVRGLFNAHALTPKMFYGSWCGRTEHTDFQDIVVATRGDRHPCDGAR